MVAINMERFEKLELVRARLKILAESTLTEFVGKKKNELIIRHEKMLANNSINVIPKTFCIILKKPSNYIV